MPGARWSVFYTLALPGVLTQVLVLPGIAPRVTPLLYFESLNDFTRAVPKRHCPSQLPAAPRRTTHGGVHPLTTHCTPPPPACCVLRDALWQATRTGGSPTTSTTGGRLVPLYALLRPFTPRHCLSLPLHTHTHKHTTHTHTRLVPFYATPLPQFTPPHAHAHAHHTHTHTHTHARAHCSVDTTKTSLFAFV